MSKKPIDIMLDGITWEELPLDANAVHDIPYATHSGILRIGDCDLRCYHLNNGTRVFAMEDLARFFGVTLEEFQETVNVIGNISAEAQS